MFITLLIWNLQHEPNGTNKRLNFNLQAGNPPTIHPYREFDLRSRSLFLALYEPLMRKQPDGTLTFAAAESVEIDSQQTHYVFHLRKQFWSNGEPLTAHHFERAWSYALSPTSVCARADLLYPIKNAEKVKRGELPLEELHVWAPDDYTLIVDLEHPTPYFLDLTATPFFAPLYDISDREPTVFNGPFIISEWVPEQKMLFIQNPHYWDRDAVGVDEIFFTMIKDPTTALLLYEQGGLDVIGDPLCALPFDALSSLKETGQLNYKVISRMLYILVNVDIPPLNNKTLRQALALSLDRKALTDHIFLADEPAFSQLPKTMTMCDTTEMQDNDSAALVLFEQALQEIGMTRETFPQIIFTYGNLSGLKNLAQWAQEQWKKKLGIDIKIEGLDWNTHAANLRRHQHQLGLLYLTTLYPDPMFFFDLFREKTSTSNYTGWENPQFQALLDQAEMTLDQDERLLILQEAEKLLMKEVPALPVLTQNVKYMVRDGVTLELTDMGTYDFKRAKKS